MKPVREKADVGVIVARFQVAELTDGHRQILDHVKSEHDKVIVFLGLSPARVTRNNPLDFESRKQLILADYPDINVLYVKDVPSDEVWSKSLDEKIADLLGPTQTAMLYGSRESFIGHYTGKYPTTELEQEVYVSGTEMRKQIGRRVKASQEFREGVIWAAFNQYPKVMPTVDVTIWDEDCERLLFAKKDGEDLHRFVGGFADGKTPYEADARREVEEETHLSITDPEYVGSLPVDDWRYRREVDGIVTILFEARRQFGKPTPDDDIAELRWFDAKTLCQMHLRPEHRKLLELLAKKHPERLPMVSGYKPQDAQMQEEKDDETAADTVG